MITQIQRVYPTRNITGHFGDNS